MKFPMRWFSYIIVPASLLYFNIPSTDGLRCYGCSPFGGRYREEANINCLANSTEPVCARAEDRCYSLTVPVGDAFTVEKGCTQSADCMGYRICCTSEYCNAATGTDSRTGFEKQCSLLSDCVQGDPDMICQPENPGDPRTCRCSDSRYSSGAVCLKKYSPGEGCMAEDQCLDGNSTCVHGICVCDVMYFSNHTACVRKRQLMESCTDNSQCMDENAECNGYRCVCRFGYSVSNSTHACSSSTVTTTSSGFILSSAITLLWSQLIIYFYS